MLLLLVRATAGAAAGVAAWFSLGAPAIASTPHGLAARGLLPPVWLLALLVPAGVLVAHRCRRPATAVLVLPCLTILPWLFPHQLTLIWAAGPVSCILWTLLALTAVAESSRRHHRIVVASAVFVMAAFTWLVWPSGLHGDQPHYLLIATSVLEDGDLDLTNDYEESRHRPFYGGPLEPRHVVLSPTGRQYSFHGLGVAFLALPGFALGGAAGAKLLLLVISAVAIRWVYTSARLLTDSSDAAAIAVASLVLHVPFLAQAAAIYPEGPAAAITSLGIVTLLKIETGKPVSAARLIATGAALAYLPWLHLRLGVIAVSLGVATMWLLRRSPNALSNQTLFLAVPVISGTLLLASTFVMFDTWDPTAAFRQKASGSLAAAPVGMLGMLADVEFGLLVYAPALTLAPVGLARFFRAAPVVTIAGLVSVLATLLTGASYVWWGGTSSPARFLVAVLPVVAVAMSAAWSGLTASTRAAGAVLLALGFVISSWVAVAYRGLYTANFPDGRDSIFHWANPVVDLASALPSLFRPGAQPGAEALVGAVWFIVAVGLLAAVRAMGRPAPRNHVAIAAWALVGWISLSAAAVWSLRDINPVRGDGSQLSLLQVSRHSWLQTGFNQPHAFGSRRVALEHLEFSAPTDVAGVLLHAPMIPRGTYQVVHAGQSPAAGTYALEFGAGAGPVHTWSGQEDAPIFTTALPIHSVRITGSEPRIREDMRLRVLESHPDAGLPRAEQVTRYGDLFVYSFDRFLALEPTGFWLRGERTTTVVVTGSDSAAAPAVTLTLRAAAPILVKLRRGEWFTEHALETQEEIAVTMPSSIDVEVLQVHVGNAQDRRAVHVGVSPAGS